jgi:ribosomal protein L28
MQNRPFFPNLQKVKGVITPDGEALTLKTCEACEGEFLGNKFQTKCTARRLTKKKKSKR